jgi:hypothetical protein
MTAPSDLRRLREGDEFGAVLTKAAQHELSGARLQDNGRCIVEAMAAPPVPPRHLAKPAIAGVGSVAGVVAIVAVVRSLASTPEVQQPARIAAPTVDAAPAPVVVPPPDAAPTAAPLPSPVEPPAPPPPPKAAVPTTQRPSAAPSDLGEQLRRYDAATAAAREGDYQRALTTLDELERRFPRTTLAAEVDLSRADYLARSGAVDAAIAAIEKLIVDPRHAGRRAQLLRVLGDLWIRHGDCVKATRAFRDALSLGLPANEAAAVQMGIERCSAH